MTGRPTRVVMWALLGTVAAAAALLSFSALRDLALLCGFHAQLAWLLPIVVDAGAGAGCLIWLGTGSAERALRFARSLTWVLLASSVGGNAVVHYLAAYQLRPAWWLVVGVSAVAPAVLGAVVHLAVLVAQPGTPTPDAETAPLPELDDQAEDEELARARQLVAAGRAKGPYGRGRLAGDLGVSEHRARDLLEQIDASPSMRLVR